MNETKGPSSVIQKVSLHQEATSLHACAISQILFLKLLTHWGYDKYLQHINKVAHFYCQKRDFMEHISQVIFHSFLFQNFGIVFVFCIFELRKNK